MDIEA